MSQQASDVVTEPSDAAHADTENDSPEDPEIMVPPFPLIWDGWDDYAARNAISCTPGTLTKLDDGHMYVCQ
jgi:hypothetical protein